MDTHSSGFLGYAGDRHFYILACGHDKVTELVNHYHDVRHISMAFLRIEFTVLEQVVVFYHGADICILEQLVAAVHLYAEGL